MLPTDFFSKYNVYVGFCTGLSWDEHMANFTKKSESRTFPLRMMDGKVLYVNADFFALMSADFRRRYNLVKDIEGAEVSYEDISCDDMEDLLEAICPSRFHVYPVPVSAYIVPLMARLARRLEIPNLMRCCEKVLMEDVTPSTADANQLMKFFDVSYRYRMNEKVQSQLLRFILSCKPKDFFGCEKVLSSPTGNFYTIAFIRHANGLFEHAGTHKLASSGGSGECTMCTNNREWFGLKKRMVRRCSNEAKVLLECAVCKEVICRSCLRYPCINRITQFILDRQEAEMKSESVW